MYYRIWKRACGDDRKKDGEQFLSKEVKKLVRGLTVDIFEKKENNALLLKDSE